MCAFRFCDRTMRIQRGMETALSKHTGEGNAKAGQRGWTGAQRDVAETFCTERKDTRQ